MPINVIRSCGFKIIQVLTSPTFLLIATNIGRVLERQWLLEVGAHALPAFSSMGLTPAMLIGMWLPVCIFGGLVTLSALYDIVAFLMDGTSLRQDLLKCWRSFRFRRPSLRSLGFRRPLKQAQGLPPI
jgi:hypothetical protein